MRNIMGIVAACMLLATFGFLANSVSATAATPSHTLKGAYNRGQIGSACVNADGQFFDTPNGGYGCATGTGTVTCTGKGKCTGTCQNCRVLPTRMRQGLGGILAPVAGAGQQQPGSNRKHNRPGAITPVLEPIQMNHRRH